MAGGPNRALAQQRQVELPALPDLLGRTITGIDITAEVPLDSLTRSGLQAAIGIHSGEGLDLGRVRSAILRLYETGRASNVIVEASAAGSGVNLRFTITPQAHVRSVSFPGLEEALQPDLRRRLGEVDPGARLSSGLLNRAAEEVVEYLHTLGYFEAETLSTVALDATLSQADVTFTVNKGPRYTVGEIRFSGDTKIPPAELSAQMTIKTGAFHELPALQADIGRIHDLYLRRGYLGATVGSPSVEPESEARSVRISIPIESGPPVEVRVEGFSVSTKRQREILPILAEGGLGDAVLEEGRLNLLEEAQRAGYFFAEVTVTRTGGQDKSEPVHIAYRVDPGRKYKLAEIRVEGTNEVDIGELADRLGSKLGGLFNRGVTSRALMRQDQQAIVAHLKNQGYRHATLKESRLAVTIKGENLVIIYVVEAGSQSRIAEIAFEGQEQIRSEELSASANLAAGQPYAEAKVNEATRGIVRTYTQRGFAESEVATEVVEIDPTSLRILFRIKEGPQIRIRRIIVVGTELTHEASVRKFLAFREGDLLDKEKLQESEQQLLNTGSFRQVTISMGELPAGSGLRAERDVIIELAESQRYQLAYGGGFRTDDGPRGLFEISNSNLLGRLYTGGIRLRVSRREQIAQLSLTDPRPFRLPWPALLSAFYQRQQEVAFDARRLTGLLQLERRLTDISQILFRYSYSDVLITNVTNAQNLRREDTTARIGRISVSYLRDERNAIFDSTSGNFTSIDFSVASSVLLGAENFIRFFGEHQRFYTVKAFPSIVFAADARVGLSTPFGRSRLIPISERFFAGGSTTLRGLGFEQAGPRVPDAIKPGQTTPTGGNALIVLNGELRFPIAPKFRLGGALFYDTGNIFDRISNISPNRFTHTLGFGLRIRTPVGPIRVDFGYLLRREPLVPRSATHITFGPPF